MNARPQTWKACSGNPLARQTVEGRASTAAVAAKDRSLSPFSHGLTGRRGTIASMPDAR